jgi:hypothetical protein
LGHVSQSTLRHASRSHSILCHSGLVLRHLSLLLCHHALTALKLGEDKVLGRSARGGLHLTNQLVLREVLQALLKFKEVHPVSPL